MKVAERHSAEEIGRYGYEHWSGKPVTPENHEALFVPQSIADGWEAYCSCGQWRGFASFRDLPPDQCKNARETVISCLRESHEAHKAATCNALAPDHPWRKGTIPKPSEPST